MSSRAKRTIVLGGGIIGTSVALELQSHGHQVLLIEKGDIGTGCSFANAGWVTPCFAMPLPQPGMLLKSIGWLLDNTSPLYIKPALDPLLMKWLWHFTLSMNRKKMLKSIEVLTTLSHHSLAFYSELANRHQGLTGFFKAGLLMVSGTREGVNYAETEMRLMAEHGIEGQAMNEKDIVDFEPLLKPIVKGGVYFRNEAHIEPFTATQLIAKEFEALGGVIRKYTEVYDFSLSATGGIQEVVTTGGSFPAELVVMALGTWSPTFAKRLRLRIPVLGGKGYSMSLNVKEKPKRPIMIVDRKIAVTPRANSLRLAGTLELVNQDYSISPTRVGAIYSGAHEFLKLESDGEFKELWRGLRPCTPDGVPLIGFSQKIKNLFFCTGHQMLGLQSAPGSARLARELIEAQTPFADPKPFSPIRYE